MKYIFQWDNFLLKTRTISSPSINILHWYGNETIFTMKLLEAVFDRYWVAFILNIHWKEERPIANNGLLIVYTIDNNINTVKSIKQWIENYKTSLDKLCDKALELSITGNKHFVYKYRNCETVHNNTKPTTLSVVRNHRDIATSLQKYKLVGGARKHKTSNSYWVNSWTAKVTFKRPPQRKAVLHPSL